MSKKDEEIVALKNEKDTLKARIANLEEENKQLRLRTRGLDKKLKTLQDDSTAYKAAKKKEIDTLKEKIIHLGRQTEKVMEAKNREIEELSDMMKERSFALKSSKSLDIPSHTVIHGAVLSEASLKLGENVMVDGHIDSGGEIELGANSTVKGVVRAARGATLKDGCEVYGDVESGGDVVLSIGTKAGSVRTGGNAIIGEKCSVSRVLARGDVELGNGARVEGGIVYGGSVAIGKQTIVKGTVEYLDGEEKDNLLFNSLGEGTDVEEEKEQKEKSENKGLSCPVCGTPVSPGSSKCRNCGSLVRDTLEEKKEDEEDTPNTVKRRRRTSR